ncbi:MAG: outer membrane protein [Verrucomicrobiota bacterium]|jgi:Skp family chaperone for outer membrane proteins|nr:outer membrane protein [Verrucomicrobiota bacterium]
MKKLILLGLSVFLIAGTVRAEERIVFVNLEQVFNDFYKTQLAKSKIETQQQDIEEKRQNMVGEISAISAEVDALREESRDITLAKEIRDSKRMLYEERLLELRTKQKDLEEFVSLQQKQLQQQISRMSQTIMDEIRQAVVEYAKREGLLAVIDNSSRRSAVGVFIYTHPDVEITEAILAELNSRRPVDALK